MNKNLNIVEEIVQRGNEIPSLEHSLGRSLQIPSVTSTSGSRRVMQSNQSEQIIMIKDSEIPLYQTGLENEYGKYASSIVRAEDNYEIIAKIPKFDYTPDHHYYLIIKSQDGKYDIIEKVNYRHLTEVYGYLYDNDYLNSKNVGDNIMRGTTIKKSLAYDKYDNRQDGINLLTTYLATEHTKEDGITISESARDKVVSPLIKRVKIQINSNDIPLNIYGTPERYKSFPDIGEDIQNKLVCALRREKKEDMLFSQSYDRLSQMMISDEKFTMKGKIIDVNIYCNNPEILDKSIHYSQLAFYNNEQRKFLNNFIEVVSPIINGGAECSYDLQKLYHNSVKTYNNVQFIQDKKFSNTILELVVMEDNVIDIGDKFANRYGGKGVISQVLPDHLMPRIDTGEYVEVILNSSTCINRENTSQLNEVTINHMTERIRQYAKTNCLHSEETIEMICKLMRFFVPKEADYLYEQFFMADEDTQNIIVESFLNDHNGIVISADPASEALNIDIIREMYKEFPFVTRNKVTVPLKDSNGNIRYIETRKPIVCGRQYMIRLKQYAEDKFSAVSLSATNITNMNSKTTSKKAYKTIHSKNCIKFGDMEMGNLQHMNPEVVIVNLLLHSLSPKGRRQCEKLLVDDPFDINVKLDDESTNRSVEMLNAYLLPMGLEFKFNKVIKDNKKLFKKFTHPWDTKNPMFRKIAEGEVVDGHYFNRVSDMRASRIKQPLFKKVLFKDIATKQD